MEYFIGYLIFHSVCSIICYGYTFGFSQRNWPNIAEDTYKFDMLFSMGVSLFGPLGLLGVCYTAPSHGDSLFKYGMKFW